MVPLDIHIYSEMTALYAYTYIWICTCKHILILYIYTHIYIYKYIKFSFVGGSLVALDSNMLGL